MEKPRNCVKFNPSSVYSYVIRFYIRLKQMIRLATTRRRRRERATR